MKLMQGNIEAAAKQIGINNHGHTFVLCKLQISGTVYILALI